MKNASSDVLTLLHGSKAGAFVDLVTITLADSTVVRWSTGAYDVSWGGNIYTAGGTGTAPVLRLSKIREAIGLEVSTLDLTLGCGTTATIGGVGVRALAVAGGFDSARVSVSRAYSSKPGGYVLGTMIRFGGIVSDLEADSDEVRLRVQSDIYKLTEPVPRSMIRHKCSWALYDAGCGVSKASFSQSAIVSGEVLATPTAATFGTTLGYAPTYEYVGGPITFTSGALSGLSRKVLSIVAGGVFLDKCIITVEVPFPSIPAFTDAFTVYAACDKTYATCNNVFSNTTRRRGFDFVPPPDSVG